MEISEETRTRYSLGGVVVVRICADEQPDMVSVVLDGGDTGFAMRLADAVLLAQVLAEATK